MGEVHSENEDHVPTRDKIKQAFKEMMFSTDPDKQFKTEEDIRRKFGKIEDYL